MLRSPFSADEKGRSFDGGADSDKDETVSVIDAFDGRFGSVREGRNDALDGGLLVSIGGCCQQAVFEKNEFAAGFESFGNIDLPFSNDLERSPDEKGRIGV